METERQGVYTILKIIKRYKYNLKDTDIDFWVRIMTNGVWVHQIHKIVDNGEIRICCGGF